MKRRQDGRTASAKSFKAQKKEETLAEKYIKEKEERDRIEREAEEENKQSEDECNALFPDSDRDDEEEEHEDDAPAQCVVNKTYVQKDTYRNEVNTRSSIRFRKSIEQTDDECVVCFYDCHPFEGEGYGVPISHEKDENNHFTFNTVGKFCSLECCRAYVLDRQTVRADRENSLLALMAIKLFGRTTVIKRAPDRHLLKMFGGPLNIVEYRSSLQSNNIYEISSVSMRRTKLIYDIYTNMDADESEIRIGVKKVNRQGGRKKAEEKDIPVLNIAKRSAPVHFCSSSLNRILGRKNNVTEK